MARRDQTDVAYAVVALEDAGDELRATARAAADAATIADLSAGPITIAELSERMHLSTQAVERALERALKRLGDVQTRLEQRLTAPGLPVSEAARYLGVSEPTVRAWLARGALTAVAEAKPVLVEIASLRRIGNALAELRERGQDRDWTRALVDLLQDHAEQRRPELLSGLDELRRGELELA